MAGGGGGGGGVELPPPHPAIARNKTQLRMITYELRIEISVLSTQGHLESILRVVAGLGIEVVWKLVTRIHRTTGTSSTDVVLQILIQVGLKLLEERAAI
jgi:hypothetical protein